MFGKPVIFASLLTVLCYIIMYADGSTYCYCSAEPPPPTANVIAVWEPSPTPVPPVDIPE